MIVVRCTCTHAFQDTKYGKGMRLAREGAKKGEAPRCTVCKPTRFTQRMKAICAAHLPIHSFLSTKASVKGRVIIVSS